MRMQPGLLSLKAQTLFNMKNFKEAIPYFERLVALKQDKNFILSKLAKLMLMRKRLKKLLLFILFCWSVIRKLPKCFMNLVWCIKNKRNTNLPLNTSRLLLKWRSFTFAHEYGTIAEIYRVQQDFKKALHYYLLAHKENPEDPRFYFQACVMAEKQYKDVTAKLRYYLSFKEKYSYLGDDHFYIQLVDKCIKSIKSRS